MTDVIRNAPAGEPLASPPLFDTRPRTTPEAMLEDHWRYLDLSPEQRAAEIGLVCRTAMSQWWARTDEERDLCRWVQSRAPGEEILRRWARECREGRLG